MSADGVDPLLTAARSSKPLVDLRLRSSQTFGMRLSGKKSVRALELAYLTSYANRYHYAGNPLRYDDDFYVFELVGTLREVSLGAGIETLDGDGVKGFATPLATLHKFLGWADKFGVTPPNGLDHRYATLGFARKSVGVFDTLGATLVYHRFESSRLNIDYGSEIDLHLQARWRHLTCLIKYATTTRAPSQPTRENTGCRSNTLSRART